MWKRKESKYVFKNKWLKVRQDDLDVDGIIFDYYFVELDDDVVVASITQKKEIIFARSYRPSIGKMSLELPAGFIDKGKSPEESALSELEEETGYKAGKIEELGKIHRSTSKLTQKTYLFLATDLEWVGQDLEHDEKHIKIIKLSLDEAVEKIAKGEITETATVNCILLLKTGNII